MFNIDSFKILVHTAHHPQLDEGQRWHDVGEGPWDNQQDAIDFANAEVGLPWIVIDGAGHPVAYGDAFGLQGDQT
jgi:hypothetical protein